MMNTYHNRYSRISVVLGIILGILSLLLSGCTAGDPITENYYTIGSVVRYDDSSNGGYWHEYNIDGIELSPGSSNATLIVPNASSLGGYQLNGLTEYLFFGSHLEADWDGTTDGVFEIFFEVNDDNTGGLVTDTVKFQLEVWHKIKGELACTVYSLSGNTIVGQSQQHELFEQEIAIGNLRALDQISFRINLNTIQSQVTDVIINYVEFKYQAYYPGVEVN